MTDLTTKEIKGISAKNIIALLSAVIFIEFTILMSYNSITNTQHENTSRIINLEKIIDKLSNENADLKTQIMIIQSRTKN